MQAPVAPEPEVVREIASLLDGSPAARQRRARANETPVAIGAGLAAFLPAPPPEPKPAPAADPIRAEVAALLADQGELRHLLAMPPTRATEQVLAIARVFDKAPRKRRGVAMQAAHLVGPAGLLALLADVVLSRPRTVAPVLLARLGRLAKGQDLQDVVAISRRDWSLERLADALRQRRQAKAPDRSEALDRSADPRVRVAAAAIVEHAQRGAWRQVNDLLHRYGNEFGWDAHWLSDRSGVDPREIDAQLEAVRATAAAEFAKCVGRTA